ncbi:MAG: hypothetical protein IJZ93_05930 [Clostridia bacterium]|nr:hypothetical protein [Clostridia bacterium]
MNFEIKRTDDSKDKVKAPLSIVFALFLSVCIFSFTLAFPLFEIMFSKMEEKEASQERAEAVFAGKLDEIIGLDNPIETESESEAR